LGLDRGGWSTLYFNHFTPRKKTWYPWYRRLGGAKGQSGQKQKITPPHYNLIPGPSSAW